MFKVSTFRREVSSPLPTLGPEKADYRLILHHARQGKRSPGETVKPYKYEQPGGPKLDSQHLPGDSTMKPDT